MTDTAAPPGLAGAHAPASAERGADGGLAGDIGRRVAAHRARRGIRVAELARAVGVTPGLISQIERGQSRPSVSTLFALSQALEVPVDAFFRETPGAGRDTPPSPDWDTAPDGAAGDTGAAGNIGAAVGTGAQAEPPGGPSRAAGGTGLLGTGGRYLLRHAARAAIDIEGGVRWERLTRQTPDHLDFFELIYQPGAQSHPRQYTHPGTEMVLMLSGSLEISVGFERYLLGPGDSIDFPSSVPHRYCNPGHRTARAATVILYDCPPRDGRAGAPPRGGPAGHHPPAAPGPPG